jgi:hypothetical protein
MNRRKYFLPGLMILPDTDTLSGRAEIRLLAFLHER